MQPFKRYFQDKMKDAGFRALYEAECHACANTVGIFESVDREKIPVKDLARDLNVLPGDLVALRDADHCDPRLVLRLCRHLGLRAPQNCAKLNAGRKTPE